MQYHRHNISVTSIYVVNIGNDKWRQPFWGYCLLCINCFIELHRHDISLYGPCRWHCWGQNTICSQVGLRVGDCDLFAVGDCIVKNIACTTKSVDNNTQFCKQEACRPIYLCSYISSVNFEIHFSQWKPSNLTLISLRLVSRVQLLKSDYFRHRIFVIQSVDEPRYQTLCVYFMKIKQEKHGK